MRATRMLTNEVMSLLIDGQIVHGIVITQIREIEWKKKKIRRLSARLLEIMILIATNFDSVLNVVRLLRCAVVK